MGGEQAGVVLSRVRSRSAKAQTEAEAAALRAEMQAQYERQSSAVYASARLWDDGIIDPVDTRAVLGASLAASNAPLDPETPYGIFRM
jgi:3-methylcrotonyl-CoA carboxylase beta subunit